MGLESGKNKIKKKQKQIDFQVSVSEKTDWAKIWTQWEPSW